MIPVVLGFLVGFLGGAVALLLVGVRASWGDEDEDKPAEPRL